MNAFVGNILQNTFTPSVTSCYVHTLNADANLPATLLCYFRCNWCRNLAAVNCILHWIVLILSSLHTRYSSCITLIWFPGQSRDQARNQLGAPRETISFLRGAQIFCIMSNRFELCPKHFFKGGENFSRGASSLEPPWLRVLHIPGYGSGRVRKVP